MLKVSLYMFLYLPIPLQKYGCSKENGTITENGKSINAVAGLKLKGYPDGYAVIEIGSGDYSFKSNF